MALEPPPPWATAEEVEEHGRLFLSIFYSRHHFDHFLKTGSLRRPADERAAAKAKANPIAVQRKALSSAVSKRKAAIKRLEAELEEARNRPPMPFEHWEIRGVTAISGMLDAKRSELASAELNLAVFREFHNKGSSING